VERLTDTSTR